MDQTTPNARARRPSFALRDDIAALIRDSQWAKLASPSLAWPDEELVAPEIVDALHDLEAHEQVLLFRSLPKAIAAEVFSYLEGDTRDDLLTRLTDAETRRLLAELNPDDRTHLLHELPGRVTQRLLNLLDPTDLAEARTLLGYPEDSVGRLMTPDYLAVKPDWTVGQALEHVRRRGQESETANVIYVVDPQWRLLDDLPLRRLVLAEPSQHVSEVMDFTVVRLDAREDREEAVHKMQRYDRVALPVVDSTGVLVGIVTIDDVFDVAQEEVTEDFHLSGAMLPLRTSYWETTKLVLFRARIGWLAALVLVNLVSSGVIAAFEEVLQSAVALAFFIPLIIDTGGNAGSQSATMMIRALSVGDVKPSQWLRALRRELLIGLAIGGTLGTLGMLLGVFRGGFAVGLVVLLTMVTMLVLTNLVGVLLPFVLTRLHLDPAIASGPLITSIADAVGLIIYFSIAVWVLGPSIG